MAGCMYTHTHILQWFWLDYVIRSYPLFTEGWSAFSVILGEYLLLVTEARRFKHIASAEKLMRSMCTHSSQTSDYKAWLWSCSISWYYTMKLCMIRAKRFRHVLRMRVHCISTPGGHVVNGPQISTLPNESGELTGNGSGELSGDYLSIYGCTDTNASISIGLKFCSDLWVLAGFHLGGGGGSRSPLGN